MQGSKNSGSHAPGSVMAPLLVVTKPYGTNSS
jgi:hypothetical protein